VEIFSEIDKWADLLDIASLIGLFFFLHHQISLKKWCGGIQTTWPQCKTTLRKKGYWKFSKDFIKWSIDICGCSTDEWEEGLLYALLQFSSIGTRKGWVIPWLYQYINASNILKKLLSTSMSYIITHSEVHWGYRVVQTFLLLSQQLSVSCFLIFPTLVPSSRGMCHDWWQIAPNCFKELSIHF